VRLEGLPELTQHVRPTRTTATVMLLPALVWDGSSAPSPECACTSIKLLPALLQLLNSVAATRHAKAQPSMPHPKPTRQLTSSPLACPASPPSPPSTILLNAFSTFWQMVRMRCSILPLLPVTSWPRDLSWVW
jgi:hypothetical protein